MRGKIAVLLILGIWMAGCGSAGKAKIKEMIPGMSSTMETLECWLTIEFTKYPKSGSPRDVKVKFSSIALEGDEVFDWAYIAEHDVISLGFMKGFKPNDASSPSADPPLDTPLKIKFPLSAKSRIELDAGQVIELKAQVIWAGEVVETRTTTIEHVYQRE